MTDDTFRPQQIKGPHSVTVDPWILEADLLPITLAVYLRLRSHFGPLRTIQHIGLKPLSVIAGCSPSVLRRALQQLHAAGVVDRKANYRADGGQAADTITFATEGPTRTPPQVSTSGTPEA